MTTAFVGSSGRDKSTTIAPLERLYDPWQGKILLRGHDIKVLNLQQLRLLMGLVQQESVLFNLFIQDNIAYGDKPRPLTQSNIEQAARMACALENKTEQLVQAALDMAEMRQSERTSTPIFLLLHSVCIEQLLGHT